MKCPYCAHPESKVVDSRPSDEGGPASAAAGSAWRAISGLQPMRPWRVCLWWSSRRMAAARHLTKSKLLNGMIGPVRSAGALGKLEEIANEIEQVLQNDMDREIPRRRLGSW